MADMKRPIEAQIAGLHTEQTALEQSDRERAIAIEMQKAENTARDLTVQRQQSILGSPAPQGAS